MPWPKGKKRPRDQVEKAAAKLRGKPRPRSVRLKMSRTLRRISPTPAQLEAAKRRRVSWTPWERRIQRVYGLSLKQIRKLVKEASGKCQICGSYGDRGRRSGDQLQIDHRGRYVRGLVCAYCNQRIGLVESSHGRAILRYLSKKPIIPEGKDKVAVADSDPSGENAGE